MAGMPSQYAVCASTFIPHAPAAPVTTQCGSRPAGEGQEECADIVAAPGCVGPEGGHTADSACALTRRSAQQASGGAVPRADAAVATAAY